VPGLERLAKLKDYRNTSVIVSNHPYAAAAVMGRGTAAPNWRDRTSGCEPRRAPAPMLTPRMQKASPLKFKLILSATGQIS